MGDLIKPHFLKACVSYSTVLGSIENIDSEFFESNSTDVVWPTNNTLSTVYPNTLLNTKVCDSNLNVSNLVIF